MSHYFQSAFRNSIERSFLLHSLGRLRDQMTADFEVCISDGGSTDGRDHEIVEFPSTLGHATQLQAQEEPAPYDRNLRGGDRAG